MKVEINAPGRLEAAVQAQRQAGKIAESQKKLIHDELERQEAEERLALLTQQVNSDVEEVTRQFHTMGVSVEKLSQTFLTPPSTPSHAKVFSNPSPPGTPTCHAAVGSPSPGRPPKGTVLRPSPNAQCIYPGSRYPAYVLYRGKEHAHGVFYAWMTYKKVPGAKDLYDPQSHDHVVRSFSSRELAHEFYQEFVDAGIPELLAESEPSDDEHFIVIEGVKPMACKTRKTLIMDALQFRGGVAYRFLGDMGSAWAQFREFEAQGLVRSTHPSRTQF
ncbi:hypothetical protein F5890DRAFT_1557577 [Lentinula detonsa]|uniref:Uncharacterized protein n=1 Tax=Lentinula detonsa TaxID=2804962 RepID=A0AA38UNV7_9AGAR|nr:hypothetical protein F5890DRAFT_1557577 [Lentinula detonsa]